MLILNRQIRVVEEKTTNKKYNNSQASINSSGCITIRNYNGATEDEMIILSSSETKAILKLMHELKIVKPDELPF